MPITQSRMIALLRAAQDYKQALEILCNTLARQEAAVAQGTLTIEQAAAVCFSSANAVVLLTDPIHSAEVIGIEAAHFRANERRNNNKAEKSRRLRQESGTPIAPTAPHRMDGTFTREKAIINRLGAVERQDQQLARFNSLDPSTIQVPTEVSADSIRAAEEFNRSRAAAKEFEKRLATPAKPEKAETEAEKRIRAADSDMDAGEDLF